MRGVRLNDLIGRRFRVGSVECYGVKLCEPCLTLEGNTRPGIIRELVHRAGINADILNDGTISVGDADHDHGRLTTPVDQSSKRNRVGSRVMSVQAMTLRGRMAIAPLAR